VKGTVHKVPPDVAFSTPYCSFIHHYATRTVFITSQQLQTSLRHTTGW